MVLTGRIPKEHHYNVLWFEKAISATATHFMDALGTTGSADQTFQIDAGDNTWGSWVQLVGEDDWPANSKYGIFDRIGLAATERAAPYFFQVAWGATGDAGVTAVNYSTETIFPAAITGEAQPVIFQTNPIPYGSKVWARCLCPQNNTATMNFYLGGHVDY